MTSVLTTAAAPGETGEVVVDWADCRIANDGFEPPTPLTGTVVVGAGATVVAVVAGAAVVGGAAAGATVVTGVLPACSLLIPWAPVWVPAGGEAGAVWAVAGRALSTRRRPARSANDATHRRGLTTSIRTLKLIGLNRPPWLGCVRGTCEVSAGTTAFNHGPEQPGNHAFGL